MEFKALKFTAGEGLTQPRRLRFDPGDPQELARALAPKRPAALVLDRKTLAELKTETFKDLVEDSGVKPENQGLAGLLFGRGPHRIPIIDGNYGAHGRVTQGLSKLLERAATEDPQGRYVIGVRSDVFQDLWDQSPESEAEEEAWPDDPEPDAFGPLDQDPDEPDLMDLIDFIPNSHLKVKRFLGESPQAEEVRQKILYVAEKDIPVMICGPSGTGKEVVAEEIHRLSKRRHGPWVPVNCAAIPTELFEAELFGYEPGAFTGADARPEGKPGLWEEADGGTLFLDEIGDLAPRHQAKTLRVIDTGQTRRLGATETRQVDVRILSASNQDLIAKVNADLFREDLYYRLLGVLIKTRPFCQHSLDVPLVAEKFWKRIGDPRPLPPDVIEELKRQPWTGNARELRSVLDGLHAYFPDRPLKARYLRAVAHLEGYHLESEIVEAGGDEVNRHLAQCLRHLKQADNLIYNISVVVQPLLRSKRPSLSAADAVRRNLVFDLRDLGGLCRSPDRLWFHTQSTYLAVKDLLEKKLRPWYALLQEDPPEAARQWKEEIAGEIKLVSSAIFQEVEKVQDQI
jgi:transcriptional regulator with AAA-type ATPase domain